MKAFGRFLIEVSFEGVADGSEDDCDEREIYGLQICGLEIARQFAQAGGLRHHGSRDAARAQTALDDLSSQGLKAQSISIDFNDHASIAAVPETIRVEHGRLDILVNNAGIVDAQDGPPTASSAEAARRIIDTNFVSTLAVTQVMLPLLRQAPAARIVNQSVR